MRNEEEGTMTKLRNWLAAHGTRARRGGGGFTLLEIMIVLAIIGLIAGAVSIAVIPKVKKAKIQAAQLGIKKIVGATESILAGPGASCPKGMEDLVSQGEIRKGDVNDPWGTPYTYRCPGTQSPEGVDVVSAGPDKKPGSEDDIKSWEIQ
jgi:general secretion pathway protein G